jgi:hypothetical protein
MAGGKPIVVRLLSISDVSAGNALVAFYDIHVRKEEVFFYHNYSKLATRPCFARVQY